MSDRAIPSSTVLHAASSGRTSRYLGMAITVLAILLLAMDAGFKIALASPAVTATAELGFSPGGTRVLGIVLAAATILHAIPRTGMLGAIILTGYLGGAVAVHAQHGSPLATHTLFGVYVGVVLWAGLWLRDPGLRALIPVRRPGTA